MEWKVKQSRVLHAGGPMPSAIFGLHLEKSKGAQLQGAGLLGDQTATHSLYCRVLPGQCHTLLRFKGYSTKGQIIFLYAH